MGVGDVPGSGVGVGVGVGVGDVPGSGVGVGVGVGVVPPEAPSGYSHLKTYFWPSIVTWKFEGIDAGK